MKAIAKSDPWPARSEVVLEVGILVPLVVFALIALAIPVVLVVMSIINVLSWVIGRIW
jgi:hypothetical protein